jgi:Cdc6-like AAA superfamily ATPase
VCGVTIIGIANSIELFKGEYTASTASMSSKLICRNEEKIIFSPYTRQQVSSILRNICDTYINSKYPVNERKTLKESLLT